MSKYICNRKSESSFYVLGEPTQEVRTFERRMNRTSFLGKVVATVKKIYGSFGPIGQIQAITIPSIAVTFTLALSADAIWKSHAIGAYVCFAIAAIITIGALLWSSKRFRMRATVLAKSYRRAADYWELRLAELPNVVRVSGPVGSEIRASAKALGGAKVFEQLADTNGDLIDAFFRRPEIVILDRKLESDVITSENRTRASTALVSLARSDVLGVARSRAYQALDAAKENERHLREALSDGRKEANASFEDFLSEDIGTITHLSDV